MAEPQTLVPNLNELMEEYTAGEEEVHLEPQTETTPVAEPEVQRRHRTLLRNKKGRKELKKVELSKLRKQKTMKLSFQMKPTPYGERT